MAQEIPTEPGGGGTASATRVPTTRRRFLRGLLGFSVMSTMAMVFAPVIAFLIPTKTGAAGAGDKVLAGTVDDIPLGQGKVVAMGSQPTIVLNTAQGVIAFSAICTHLGCIVAFDSGSGLIVCPCHDGRFNATTGAVVSGPPPAPLPAVKVSVEDSGEIFLIGS